jgi:hypothetical protein
VPYTIADLIRDARAELSGELGVRFNLSASGYDDDDTALVFLDDLGPMRPGSQLVVQDTGEQMYVRSVNTGALTATVMRGWAGTTAEAIPADSIIEVDPRWSPQRVRRAVHAELRSLPPSLFQVVSWEGTVGAGGRTMTLDHTDALRILEVRRDADMTYSGYRDNHPDVTGWQIERYSGALAIPHDASPSIGTTFYVTYARGFDTVELFDWTDLEADCGLPQRMHDIPLWGACGQVLMLSEAARLDLSSANQAADYEQLPATATAQVGATFLRQRDQRIRSEADYLRALYGIRTT